MIYLELLLLIMYGMFLMRIAVLEKQHIVALGFPLYVGLVKRAYFKFLKTFI